MGRGREGGKWGRGRGRGRKEPKKTGIRAKESYQKRSDQVEGK